MNSSEDIQVNTQSDSSTEQPSSEQGWSTFDASPGSEETQPVRLVLASRRGRFVGSLIDWGAVTLIQMIVAFFLVVTGDVAWEWEFPLWYGWFAFLLGPLYSWLMTGLNDGRTLGKIAMGTKVVNEDGIAPSLLTAFMREVIGKFISAIVLYLGFIWIIFDSKFQGWHDKIASTYVIKVEK